MNTKVSVLICTRDRPDTVGQAIESVATCDYPEFDVHVMDQSTTDDTRLIVESIAAGFAGRCQILYHHLDKAGLSRAYNTGIRESDGAIIACTDDDVIVPQDWLSHIVEAFETDPELGLLYGQVLVPESLEEAAASGVIVPTLWRTSRLRLSQKDRNFTLWGMGADMALRRTMLADVVGFDEALGGGAPLRSSQDFDFSFRVYRAGYAILLDPSVKVDHYGSRTPDQWTGTQRNYGIGDGAFYSKHIRCRDLLAAWLLVHQFAWVLRGTLTSWVRGRRPAPSNEYGRGLLTGIRLGSRFGVDRQTRLYVKPPGIDVTAPNAVTGVVRGTG